MAASTKSFDLTSAAYQDISESATYCQFTLRFNRQAVSAVRIHLGQSLPSAGTVNYELVSANVNDVGPDNVPRDYPVEFKGLAATDRVYARADDAPVNIKVHRI